jgi:hypothetical protein
MAEEPASDYYPYSDEPAALEKLIGPVGITPHWIGELSVSKTAMLLDFWQKNFAISDHPTL